MTALTPRRPRLLGTLRDFDRTLNQLEAWASLQNRPADGPPVQLTDDGEAFVLTAEVPGIALDDLTIEATADTLTVSGRRSQGVPDGYTALRLERPEWSFSRTFQLPREVDVEAVEATLSNGIAVIRAPKRPETLPRRITVKVGGDA